MSQRNQFINALKNPDTQETAFNKLLSDYKERLYWHVRKIVIDHNDANDVLQNTFLKVFENINKFKGNSSIYTWMFRIATNESLNYINKKAKKFGLSNEEWIAKKSDEKLSSRLPEKQRIVFNMRYFEEMNYKKISEILGTSEGGLKASYHHAVKKIKTYLNE